MPIRTEHTQLHPTKAKLIDTVRRLMLSQSVESITVDRVLEESGVSRGSLYHHFDGFPGLIADVLGRDFSASVDRSIALLQQAIGQAQSREDLIARFDGVTRATQAPDRRAVRYDRARIIVHAESNPRLTAVLEAEQRRLTDALASVVADCQRRGWVNPALDTRAVAVLLQAYTLGKIVDDVSETPMDPEAWNTLIGLVIRNVFCS